MYVYVKAYDRKLNPFQGVQSGGSMSVESCELLLQHILQKKRKNKRIPELPRATKILSQKFPKCCSMHPHV